MTDQQKDKEAHQATKRPPSAPSEEERARMRYGMLEEWGEHLWRWSEEIPHTGRENPRQRARVKLALASMLTDELRYFYEQEYNLKIDKGRLVYNPRANKGDRGDRYR